MIFADAPSQEIARIVADEMARHAQSAAPVMSGWLGLVLQGGALVILAYLAWKVPGSVKLFFKSQTDLQLLHKEELATVVQAFSAEQDKSRAAFAERQERLMEKMGSNQEVILGAIQVAHDKARDKVDVLTDRIISKIEAAAAH